MSLRKMLIGGCVSAALFATGAATHALAADRPHDRMNGQMDGKFDPAGWHKQMCTDHFARNVGRVAYVEAKLSLNDSQRPLFDSWKQTVLGSAKSREGDCLSRQARPDGMHEHSIIERQARMQAMLQSRLADMNAEMPSLKALYDSLTPEQKQVFDHGAGGDRGMHGHGMRDQGEWHHGEHGPQAQQAD